MTLNLTKFVFVGLATLCSFALTAQAGPVAQSLSVTLTPASGASLEQQRLNVYFGHVPVNNPSFQDMSLKNNGPSVLTFTRFEVSGMPFGANTTCATTIEPGERCYIQMRFTPWAKSYFSGWMNIELEDSDRNLDRIWVDLSGSGY